MNSDLKNIDMTISDSTKDQGIFRRNPSPENKNHRAISIVQELSWGSLFPLLSVFIKHGPILIYYLSASRGGMRLGALLYFFKISVSPPLQINDRLYIDTPYTNYWNIQYHVVKACRDKIEDIQSLLQIHLPKCTNYVRKIMANNVSQAWQASLTETLILCSLTRQLGKQEGIPLKQVNLITRYSSLIKILNLNFPENDDVSIVPHPDQNKINLYAVGTVALSVWEFFLAIFYSTISKSSSSGNSKDIWKIGVAAAWGTDGMDKNQKNDFFWWHNTKINPIHLVYMFERENFQPTKENVKQAQNLGITSVGLNPKFMGNNPELHVKNLGEPSILKSLQRLFFAIKLYCKILVKDPFSKAILALVSWQYYSGNKLADIYRILNLKGVFHFDDAGMDIISLASAMNGSIRFGTPWSSNLGINNTSFKTHQVYFLWGQHNAQIALDAGTMSKSLLIAGCFLSDHSHREAKIKAEQAAANMKKRGVRFIITLLPSSPPSPEFFRFFLQWLADDPHLGLMIKSKIPWDENSYDGLDGLIGKSIKTNRIHIVDHKASPADAALASDFTVGIINTSALAVAALKGARVIFLDYEQIDQGPQKPYGILHSLGPNRCVFYEPEAMRQAIVSNFEDPSINPELGNAEPVLDQLDPFRDGKASLRIGEFIEWYMDALNSGSDSAEATRFATDRYAKKWGADKVIRRG